MPKYTPLREWLKRHPEDNVVVTFSEIEKIIGERLPRNARKYFKFWDNTQGTMAIHAIRSAGFQTVMVDRQNETVRLKRTQGV
ncbi:MAG: hypothetical protein ACE5KP_04645 [Dehalococcoidales bacterium]